VVIAIIGILASLLLPALTDAKERAKTAFCVNNQKQIGIAIFAYADDNDRVLPNSCPHGGWSPFQTVSGYYQETYWDTLTNSYKQADGPPGRHLYRGLGYIWAAGCFERETLLCPGYHNNTESDCIWYRNQPNWGTCFQPSNRNPNYSPHWRQGTYVFYSWSYRSGMFGVRARRIDWSPPLTRAFSMCRQPAFGGTSYGAHRLRTTNVLYDDGRVTIRNDVQRFLTWQQMKAQWFGSPSNNSGLGWWWSSFVDEKY